MYSKRTFQTRKHKKKVFDMASDSGYSLFALHRLQARGYRKEEACANKYFSLAFGKLEVVPGCLTCGVILIGPQMPTGQQRH